MKQLTIQDLAPGTRFKFCDNQRLKGRARYINCSEVKSPACVWVVVEHLPKDHHGEKFSHVKHFNRAPGCRRNDAKHWSNRKVQVLSFSEAMRRVEK